jgi:hypothetical protein
MMPGRNDLRPSCCLRIEWFVSIMRKRTVPRPNRVTPFGEIVAVPERGTFMGNRGILHDEAERIRRPWQLKRWLVCVLEFRGRKRSVMTPNRYTELFFLDEATALAAGHRPCAECRHACFVAFCDAWATANGGSKASRRPTASDMDNQLHAERVAPDGSKRTYSAKLDDLPNGVFVTLPEADNQAYLAWDDALLAWSPGGYGARRPRHGGEQVTVLTPPSTVGALRAGYVPEIHG